MRPSVRDRAAILVTVGSRGLLNGGRHARRRGANELYRGRVLKGESSSFWLRFHRAGTSAWFSDRK